MHLSVSLAIDLSLSRVRCNMSRSKTSTFMEFRTYSHYGCVTHTHHMQLARFSPNGTLPSPPYGAVLMIAALAVRILPRTSMPNHTCVEPLAFRVCGIDDSIYAPE